MGVGIIRIATLAVALALLGTVHARDPDYGDTLQQADRVRSTDPARFRSLLDQLVRDEARATDAQRHHLRLLQSYQRALRGQYDTAIRDSVALADQAAEVQIRYRAALLVANVAAINRDYIFGLRYLDRALAVRDEVTDPQLRDMGDVVAGTLFNEFGHHDKALEHAERLLREASDGRNRCFGRQIFARAGHGLGRALDVDRDLQSAIADCAEQKEGIAVAALRGTLAEYWADQGRTREAVAVLETALPGATATGYTRIIGEIRSLLAKYSLALGDAGAAKAHADAVVGMKGQDPRSLAYVTAQQVLYSVALGRGDAAAALDHYRRYAEADKARLDDVKAREYAFQLTRHELAQKNQSIELLSNQNQVLRLQQEVARRSGWNFRLAIALLGVVAASAAYWGWRARRTHRSLRHLANTDGLTGLSNRRHFRARSEAVLATCAQQARPVSMLLLDLDHFKQINDRCGHSTGDWVLREVARVVRRHCREGDLFGRIGGEEYALALVDCDVDAAMRIAEQCRASIETVNAGEVGCGLPVAASIGVVGSSASGYDYETLIAHADAAMYRSKVAGRNRVSVYEAPTAPQHAHHAVMDSRNAEAMLRQY